MAYAGVHWRLNWHPCAVPVEALSKLRRIVKKQYRLFEVSTCRAQSIVSSTSINVTTLETLSRIVSQIPYSCCPIFKKLDVSRHCDSRSSVHIDVHEFARGYPVSVDQLWSVCSNKLHSDLQFCLALSHRAESLRSLMRRSTL